MRAIAVPEASASRQPRAPHAHSSPSGSTMTWPMCPALPSRAVEQAAVEHDAAADAGRHDHREVVASARARRRPNLHRVRAPWRRCRRTPAARLARRAGARNGKPRHAGMLSGETCSPPRSIGPPQPTPTRVAARSGRSRRCRLSERRRTSASASVPCSGRRACGARGARPDPTRGPRPASCRRRRRRGWTRISVPGARRAARARRCRRRTGSTRTNGRRACRQMFCAGSSAQRASCVRRATRDLRR